MTTTHQASNLRKQAFELALKHLADLNRIPNNLEIRADPRPVYIFKTTELTNNAIPLNAKQKGWQYIAGTHRNEVVIGEVSDELPPRVISMRTGQSAKSIMNAHEIARKWKSENKPHAETRVLRVPGAVKQGIWLKAENDKEHFVVPFGPAFLAPGGDLARLEPIIPMEKFLLSVNEIISSRRKRETSRRSKHQP